MVVFPNELLLYSIFCFAAGQTLGSTHVEPTLRDQSGNSGTHRRTFLISTARDSQPRRRQDADQTVFKIYKGVKTFDFSKEKNVIVTGGIN